MGNQEGGALTTHGQDRDQLHEPHRGILSEILVALFIAIVLAAFVAVASFDFLLFHVLAESMSICVAAGAFFVAWHTRRMAADSFLTFLGLALLSVGGLDFAHTLTYKGMTVLAVGDANVPTQIWIAGRLLLGMSLMAAPLLLGRKLNAAVLAGGFAAISLLLLGSVATGLFPDCWVEGQGLTAFKIVSEYLVCAMLAAAGLLFHAKRRRLDKRFLPYLYSALIAFILSEFAFTLYRDVYGVTIILGHLLKILAFLALYRGIINLGLSRPLIFLFRDLKAREDQLARSEHMLKEAQAIAGVGSFRHIPAESRWEWSDQTFRLLGLEPGELEPSLDLFLDRVDPDQRKGVEQAMGEILAGKRPFDFECRILTSQGEARFMRVLGAVTNGPDQRPASLHGTLQDISTRKQSEIEQEDRRAINATIADLAGRILSLHGLEEISALALDTARTLTRSPNGFTGYLEQNTGLVVIPCLDPAGPEQCNVQHKTMAQGLRQGLWGWCLDHKQTVLSNEPDQDQRATGMPPGHVRIRRFLAAPALLGQHVLGLIAVANSVADYTERDVMVLERIARLYALGVERIRHEDELRKLSRAVEQSPVAIAITNQTGIVEYVNPAHRRITGFTPEEVLGKHLEFLTLEEEAPLRETIWAEVAQGRPWRGDLQGKTKDGRLFWETLSIAPVINDTGEVTHCIAVKQDITERVELEQLKEDVDRILRHDLRAPLTAILGLPQVLLADDSMSKESKEYLGMIQDAGYRMLNMINQSLELYRMETGTYTFSPASVDLLKILRRLLTDLKSKMSEQGVAVSLRLNDHEPTPRDSFTVLGEEPLCYSLFANLMSNALEASPSGETVTVELKDDNPRQICVKNKGAVPHTVRDRFFEKFVTSGKKMGTGLGTYSAKLMTETQGGTITMTTTQNHTCITVTLPAAE